MCFNRHLDNNEIPENGGQGNNEIQENGGQEQDMEVVDGTGFDGMIEHNEENAYDYANGSIPYENLGDEEVMVDAAPVMGGQQYLGENITFVLVAGDEQQLFTEKRELFGHLRFDSEYCYLPSSDPVAFGTILSYLKQEAFYIVNKSHATEVYRLAKYFSLDTMLDYSSDYLQPETLDEIWRILSNSIFDDDHRLVCASLDIIEKNVEEFLNSPHLLQVESYILGQILRKEEVHINHEVKIVQAMTYWAAERCLQTGIPVNQENMRDVLGYAFHQIPFPGLTEEQLNVHASSILTDQEKFMMLEKRNDYLAKIKKAEPEHPYVQLSMDPSTTPISNFSPELAETRVELFKAMRVLTLISIQVPARIQPNPYGHRYYYEHIEVNLTSITGVVISKGSYEGLAKYGQEIDIKLNSVDPLGREGFSMRGSLFRIEITFKNDGGTYPLFKPFLTKKRKKYPIVICGQTSFVTCFRHWYYKTYYL